MSGIQFKGPLTGNVTATILDNDGNPSEVIEASEDFTVRCTWSVDAFTASIMGGTWQLDVYGESIGEGFEGQLGFTDVSVVSGQLSYAADVVVPAGKLQNDPPPPPPSGRISGAYKLVLVLTHRNAGGITTSVAGYVEFPVALVR